jgi:hypothetical protein
MAKRKITAMTFPVKAHLRERSSGTKVPATVHPMSETDLAQWTRWVYGSGDQDHTWEWDKILEESGSGRTECYTLYAEEQLQGLACFDTKGHATATGLALVVDYLASRPENRGGGFKDVGTALIVIAIHRSRELGWAGRLWLESLPGAEDVYKHLGFTKLAGHSKDGYAMFELSEENAGQLFNLAHEKNILSLP